MNNQSRSQQQEVNNFWRSVLTSGLIVGAAWTAIQMLIAILFGGQGSFLGILALFLGIYFTQKYYRDKHQGGFLSYGKALRYGVLTMGGAGLLTGLLTALVLKMMPGIWQEIIVQVETAYYQAGFSDAQITQMIEPIRGGVPPLVFVFSIQFAFLFYGLFISLITSAMVKKDKPNTFADEMRNVN